MGTFQGAGTAGVRLTQVLDAHIESIRRHGMLLETLLTGDARQPEPIDGQLRVAGQARPVCFWLPIFIQAAGQGAVGALLRGNGISHAHGVVDVTLLTGGLADFHQPTHRVSKRMGQRRRVVSQAVMRQEGVGQSGFQRPIGVGVGGLQPA